VTRTEISKELESAYAREFRIIAEQVALQAAVSAESEFRRLLSQWCEHDLAHARRLGRRLLRLERSPPGTNALARLWPDLPGPGLEANSSVDVLSSLRAENINHYQQILLLCEGGDVVTQDLIIEILSQEQSDAEALIKLRESLLLELPPESKLRNH
jgi:bacterioferritin (cytochrome b1)